MIPRALLTLAALLALAACGDDSIVQPITASSCITGDLTAGRTVTGDLSERSCVIPYHFVSDGTSPTATYRVSLERGRGYWFYMRQAPDADGRNEVDALLTLWGRDANGASTPLAASDDDAGGRDGHDAEFYFIAARSGAFNLTASSYSGGEFGGYRLTMAECPVVAALDSAGLYAAIPVPPSECVRHDLAGSGDPSHIVLVTVAAEPYEVFDLDVASADFVPSVEIGGPDFDVFGTVFTNTRFDAAFGNPSSVQLVTRDVGGTLTLAVGSDHLDPNGRFSIDLARASQVNLVDAAGDGRLTLRSASARRAKH